MKSTLIPEEVLRVAGIFGVEDIGEIKQWVWPGTTIPEYYFDFGGYRVFVDFKAGQYKGTRVSYRTTGWSLSSADYIIVRKLWRAMLTNSQETQLDAGLPWTVECENEVNHEFRVICHWLYCEGRCREQIEAAKIFTGHEVIEIFIQTRRCFEKLQAQQANMEN